MSVARVAIGKEVPFLPGVATASGLSAQYITFASLAGSGDHIVSSANLYGGSITQLDVTLRRFGLRGRSR